MSQQQQQKFTSGLITPASAPQATEAVPTRPDITAVAATVESLPPAPAPVAPEVGEVRCVHGANETNSSELVGKTVGWVRDNMKSVFNIADGAVSLIDGKRVDENTVLKAGQTLEFLRESGRKG